MPIRPENNANLGMSNSNKAPHLPGGETSQSSFQATNNLRLKVAMGQMLVEPGKHDANLWRAEQMISDAAKAGAAAIVLPETLDLGWTASAAQDLAQPINGSHCFRLRAAARRSGIVVVGGLTERAGDLIFNSAVLIDADGSLVAVHRKIAELDFAREVYAPGQSPTVAGCSIGRVGLAVCADLWTSRIGLELGAIGASILLSPCAWAVPPGFDNTKTPYGSSWIESYRTIAQAYSVPVVGVSNVGPLTSGGWSGYACIGASVAMGGDGRIVARGPFGPTASDLVFADLYVRRPTLTPHQTVGAPL